MIDNRIKLLKLIKSAAITQREVAVLIAAQTGVPCSERSVRAWLADTAKSSARNCPDWAIIALETKIQNLKKMEIN